MTGGKPRLEVLAPAGSMEALTAAVRCGADAVYLGQKNFSARKNSQNFDGEELREAVAYAHRCGVKIHQALNIVVLQQELEALKACIRTAVEAGVDAMIVQDWGVAALVRRFAPDMPLHASTQMAVHSPAGAKLAEELGIGEITLTDIVKELEKPARDPREDMPRPILRSDVLDMKDLKPGMVLKGTVRNVIDFGVFVDIGVHQDGLVHISQITDRFIKHPLEAVSVGDIVDVKVLDVDPVKKRIGLTMRLDQK